MIILSHSPFSILFHFLLISFSLLRPLVGSLCNYSISCHDVCFFPYFSYSLFLHFCSIPCPPYTLSFLYSFFIASEEAINIYIYINKSLHISIAKHKILNFFYYFTSHLCKGTTTSNIAVSYLVFVILHFGIL